MKILPALIHRELLEYRISFFFAPIVLVVLITTLMVLSALSQQVHTGDSTLFLDIRLLEKMDEMSRHSYFHRLLNNVSIGLQILFVLVAINYASGTLFNARRDGSDMFWRSLPISPWADIAAKLLTILTIVPLVYFFCTGVIHVACLGLVSYIGQGHGVSIVEQVWGSANLTQQWSASLGYLLLDSFWLAPVFCWLIVWSGYANRTPLLLSWIPLIAVTIAEQFLFDSWHVMKGALLHAAPHNLLLWLTDLKFSFLPAEIITLITGDAASRPPDLDELSIAARNPSLWIGAAMAVVFYIAAVKIHQHPKTES